MADKGITGEDIKLVSGELVNEKLVNEKLVNEKDRIIAMSNHIFFPETVIVGSLLTYLKTISSLKPFLVISKTVYSNIGEKIREIISLDENSVFMFNGEPTLEELERCKEGFKERFKENYKEGGEGRCEDRHKGGHMNRHMNITEAGVTKEGITRAAPYDYHDYILSVGGGSVIDIAKAVKNSLDFNLPLVAVPTTPATGAEATPYSVLTDIRNKKKEVIISGKLLPEVVILDASLMATMSRKQMGYSIMDILGHSLEALVSRRASYLSDSFALESIRLILGSYERLEERCKSEERFKEQYSSKEQYHREALEKILTAGFLAGLAQGMAAVGLAHAFAHYVGPKYGIKHSRAVSVFIIPVIKLNMSKSIGYNKGYDKLDVLKETSKDRILDDLAKIKRHFGIDNEKIEARRDLSRGLSRDLSRNSTKDSGKDDFSVEEDSDMEKDLVIEKEISLIKGDICALTNPVRATDEELKSILEECIKWKQ